jgi:TRAP-type C4-dicarboxylate transport system permease small subunit
MTPPPDHSHAAGSAPRRLRAGTKFLEFFCAAAMATMVLMLFTQVAARYALNDPPEWTEELARTAFVYATFAGGALAVAHNAHLKIDSLVNLMPQQFQPWVRLSTTSIAIVFLGVVVYFSVQMLPQLAFQPMTALPFLSKAWFFAAVPVGCALMLVYEIARLWEHVGELRGGRAHTGT